MEYVKKYGISRFIDTRDLPFFLIRYEKGETIIHPMEHTRYLQFVVEGTVAIYSIRRDGSQFPIASSDDFMMLGDVEFVNPHCLQKPKAIRRQWRFPWTKTSLSLTGILHFSTIPSVLL